MYDDTIVRLSKELNKNFVTLSNFPVAHVGWECDSNGYIVEDYDTKERFVVLTNHGAPYIAEAQELHSKLIEYEDLASDLRYALDILNKRESF